jgi:hypothetical protein
VVGVSLNSMHSTLSDDAATYLTRLGKAILAIGDRFYNCKFDEGRSLPVHAELEEPPVLDDRPDRAKRSLMSLARTDR